MTVPRREARRDMPAATPKKIGRQPMPLEGMAFMEREMAVEALADVLTQIDTGALGATAAERAYIAGSLYALRQLKDESS